MSTSELNANRSAPVANRAISLAGIHAYAEKSVTAGSTVNFRVSSTEPYELSVVRLGWDTDGPSEDWELHTFPAVPNPAPQQIRPGSYVHIAEGLPWEAAMPALTLECWVRPFRREAWQGLVSSYAHPDHCGFGLFLADDGRVNVYFGDGETFRASWLRSGAKVLALQRWHHLVAVFDHGTARLWVDGQLDLQAENLAEAVVAGSAPLRLGAYQTDEETGGFLDGDLAMPVIYGRALSEEEIPERLEATPPRPPPSDALLGCWPLTEEGGTRVADLSPGGRHGVIVNRATWMIGGPGFDADAVPRFASYDPDTDPERGHGLRFSSEDLHDCGWQVTHQYLLPSDLPPGIYVGRFVHGAGLHYDVTFVVRRAPDRVPAPVLVLCNTNTWLAYNGEFTFNGFPRTCAYTDDETGRPAYQNGMAMPWPAAAPYVLYGSGSYSHLVRAERFMHVWLEQNGYDYDVCADSDLDADPALLGDHRVLVIAGHSEYWSAPAYEAVRKFLSHGGRVVMASGNTMYWRVSMDSEVLECRKLPTSVGGRPGTKVGELYHAHDHRRGGLMREAGYPAWLLTGLECVGYDGSFVPFTVKDPQHPFFREPELIPTSEGSPLGEPFGMGHEYDVRPSQIPGPFTPAPPAGFAPSVLADARISDGTYFDYRGNLLPAENAIVSEIVDHKVPGGGRVFAVGSIAAAAALHTDPRLGTMFRNALHHLGVGFSIDALAVDGAGRLLGKRFDGQEWGPSTTGWDELGGGFHGPATGVQPAPDQLTIMAATESRTLRIRTWSGSAWSDWDDLGGSIPGRPAAVAWGRNRLEVFATDTDGRLQQNSWTGQEWRGWQPLADGVTSDPTAIVWKGRQWGVAALGKHGSLLYWSAGEGTTHGDTSPVGMGGEFAHPPSMICWGGHRISVFAVDAAGRLFTKWWDGAAWRPSLSDWLDLGGSLSGPVTVVARGGTRLNVFGIGQNGRMKTKGFDGHNWGPSLTGWSDLGGQFVGEPTAVAYRGQHISLMAVDVHGHLQHKRWDGKAWSPAGTAWQDMGGTVRPSPALCAWAAGHQ